MACVLKAYKKEATLNGDLKTRENCIGLTFSSAGIADWRSETVAGEDLDFGEKAKCLQPNDSLSYMRHRLAGLNLPVFTISAIKIPCI